MDSSRHGVETIARRVSKWHPACGLLLERSIAYGRESDDETSSSRQARRKSRDDASGRIRAREMHHIREGKHGARSTKQAIAIGLSKARRAGVKLGRPPSSAKAKTKESAAYASRAGRHGTRRASPRRSRAVRRALRREDRTAASRKSLARQARTSARRRSAASRRASARRAVQTKGPRVRRAAARRAARTRQRRRRAATA